MAESSIAISDTFDLPNWESTGAGYPFQVRQAGRMVYYGRAMAGTGSWEGQAGEPGYITMNGLLQTLEWNVGLPHRPVRLLLYHEDAGGNPSNANYNIDYYYRDKSTNRYIRIGGGVSSLTTYIERFGETNEVSDVWYRLTIQGTNGHVIYVTPYNQYLQGRRFGPRQGVRR